MCENPLPAWLDTGSVGESGKHPVLFKLPDSADAYYVCHGHYPDRYKPISVPCGRCFQCRKKRAYDLTVRAVMESKCYDDSSFITLTVSDANLPLVFPHGVEHRPWQLFAKRLRKAIGPFRFLMCAEYGGHTCRPHYHAIIFGHRFDDRVNLEDGAYCASAVIQQCWPYGQIQCDLVNEHRIAYVAGYTLKDFQLGRDKQWYDLRGLNLPYVKWSRRPGLGFVFYERFGRSLVRHSNVWHDNQCFDRYHNEFVLGCHLARFNIRYFSQKLQLTYPQLCDKIQASVEDWLLSQSVGEQLLKYRELKLNSKCQLYRISQKDRDISPRQWGI